MRCPIAISTVAALLAFGTGPAHAQRSHVGFHGGYNFDLEDALVGAQMHIPVARLVEFYPSFDYYFTGAGGASLVGISVDLKLRFPAYPWELYLGGGVNFLRSSGNTQSAPDIFAGLETRIGNSHPYFEVRALLHDPSLVQLAAGINFTLF
ncbi:MAG: hypothetical protein ACREN5_10900 [Gemmatimonadales bacterium]